MDLAKQLVRTVARGFYTTEYILIIDALVLHSTLTDADLAHVLGMQTKALRRFAGKLKEDGLISVQSRGEKKEGAPPAFGSFNGGPPKERLFYRDWYFINFHRAIDSVKYRLWKLNRHIESQGAPTAEKKELICPRCKSSYTELEVMDNIGDEGFYCHRCGNLLEPAEDADGGPAENESMKRMNNQMAKVLALMRKIDSKQVPENDFDTALRYYLPVDRPDNHPGARTTIVDECNKPHIASAKGMRVAPEKVSVNLTEDKVDEELTEQDRAQRRAKEAQQNSLPEWISRSTLTGDVTTVGAKEIADRQNREVDLGDSVNITDEVVEESSKKDIVDNAVMDEYWRELEAAQERERQEEQEADEADDDDEDDEFEAVSGLPEIKVDEPPNKRQKIDNGLVHSNGLKAEDMKVSDIDDDEDDDDDGLEFEDV